MNKTDLSLFGVLIMVALAVIAVMEYKKRSKKAHRKAPTLADADAWQTATPSAAPASDPAMPAAVPSKPLTARERRREEIVSFAQEERCVYCGGEAESAYPYPLFTRPTLDVASLTTGDLPRHWRVRSPSDDSVVPVLCAAHYTVARSAVELWIAERHAEYVRFTALQKEAAHEFTAHGLDELMRAEAERVRKGTPKGGAT